MFQKIDTRLSQDNFLVRDGYLEERYWTVN